MHLRSWTKLALRSYALLLGIFLPVLVLTLALQAESPITDIAGTLPNAYVAFLPATLVGGTVLVMLLVAAKQSQQGWKRVWAFTFVPVVALGWPMTGIGDLLTKYDFLIALGSACVAFGASLWGAAGLPRS